MKKRILMLLLGAALVLCACQRQKTICPEESNPPYQRPDLSTLIELPPPAEPTNAPIMVEIGGKMLSVDQLVQGPLCNADWSGTVYVGCDVEVAAWEDSEHPLFLAGCDLQIEPHTVVFVADHNDAAYYKGCSCHTGEDPVE